MRRCLSVLVVLVGTASMAPAQILEGLLFGFVNNEIARSQTKVTSAVEVVCDVYRIESEGLRFLTSWNPTTQTSVWFGDDVALKVKTFVNRGAPHDHTIYVNDRVVEWRKIEGGKVVRGQPKGAKGVVGDYPFVFVRDLDLGLNQIKVRVSKTEWGSLTFVRHDLRSFLQIAADENARMTLAGSGHSTYPVLQSYTAAMPDGTIRNFASLDEFQMALNPPKELPKEGSSFRGPPQANAYSTVKMSVGMISEFNFANGNELTEAGKELVRNVKGGNQLPDHISEVKLSDEYSGAMVVLFDARPFTVEIVTGTKTHRFSSSPNSNGYEWPIWGRVSTFCVLTVKVTDQDGNVRNVRFTKEVKK